MKIYIVEDYEQMSIKAATIVASQVVLKNKAVLGLATGSTPEGMYARLVQMYKEGAVDFSEVTSFNLDEYIGLSPRHHQSYNYYMHHHLFSHINIMPENIFIPDGEAEDIDSFCKKYDEKIAVAGGIDIQVLGVGVNGHIGFNEPDRRLETGTHAVYLTRETIDSNSRFFSKIEEVPQRAVTMGMGSIMSARRIILLASGVNKAPVIKEMVNGKVKTEVPASFLQLHREAILILDKDAASLI